MVGEGLDVTVMVIVTEDVLFRVALCIIFLEVY